MTVIRLLTKNSHDQYRDSKQTDKAVLNLATKSFSTDVQNLLVQLLNDANVDVKEAHDSQYEQEILEGKDILPLDETEENPLTVEFDDDTGNRLATIVHDALDIKTTEDLGVSKRKRKRPERLDDEFLLDDVYTGKGKKKVKIDSYQSGCDDNGGSDDGDEEEGMTMRGSMETRITKTGKKTGRKAGKSTKIRVISEFRPQYPIFSMHIQYAGGSWRR